MLTLVSSKNISWAELASPVRMCSLATRPLPAEMDCDGAETQSLNIILD
jgi:hypothetical protein